MSETNNNNKPKINMPRFNLSWLYVIIAMSFGILYFSNQEGGVDKQITYTEFKDMVNKGYADKIIAYDNNTVEMFIKPEYIKDVFKNDYKKVGRSPFLNVENRFDGIIRQVFGESSGRRPFHRFNQLREKT